MSKYIWIILGIGVVSYVSYRLYRSSRKNESSSSEEEEKIKPEIVDFLGMKDVVGYFKGLNLQKGVDLPFIAQGEEIKKMLDLSDPGYEGLQIICLGVNNEKSNDFKDFKALACKEIGNDVKDLLGTDNVVTLN